MQTFSGVRPVIVRFQTSLYTTMPTQSISLATLTFLKPAELAELLGQPSASSKIAVVDVRDDDHLGGHIKSSQWVPVHQLDARMPELLRINKDKERVVFHCMLSQERGPRSALAYARARASRVEKEQKEKEGGGGEDVPVVDEKGRIGGQEVCVLEGGFGRWRILYGGNETLTEGYIKDLWE